MYGLMRRQIRANMPIIVFGNRHCSADCIHKDDDVCTGFPSTDKSWTSLIYDDEQELYLRCKKCRINEVKKTRKERVRW